MKNTDNNTCRRFFDPVRDFTNINKEFIDHDKQLLHKMEFNGYAGEKGRCGYEEAYEHEVIKELINHLDQHKNSYQKLTWLDDQAKIIEKFPLMSSKRILYLINLSRQDFHSKYNKWFFKGFCS